MQVAITCEQLLCGANLLKLDKRISRAVVCSSQIPDPMGQTAAKQHEFAKIATVDEPIKCYVLHFFPVLFYDI